LIDCLLQTPVAVATSDRRLNAVESKWSPENASGISDLSSTPAVVGDSSASNDESSKAAELGRVPVGDFTVAPTVLLGHAVPNGISVIKSCSEVKPAAAAGYTSQTSSLDRQHIVSSSVPACVRQSTCTSVVNPAASLLSFPTSAPHLSSILPFASGQPTAVNWDAKSPSVSAPISLHMTQHTVSDLFSDRSASQFPAVGHSLRSDNGRHRSVKAGSTWFPTELQKSLDSGGSTKKRTAETSSSSLPCSRNVLSSPLKQFVDRHRTRTVPSQNLSHSSEGVTFHRNAIISAAPVEPVADQPIDLSVQRRKLEPKPEQNLPPSRTHVTNSDQPLDLSRSSSSVRSETRTPRHPTNSVSRSSDSGNKLPSGMLDLQNYCSLLLSGGYSLDSPLSAITSSSSFASLVSKVYFTHI